MCTSRKRCHIPIRLRALQLRLPRTQAITSECCAPSCKPPDQSRGYRHSLRWSYSPDHHWVFLHEVHDVWGCLHVCLSNSDSSFPVSSSHSLSACQFCLRKHTLTCAYGPYARMLVEWFFPRLIEEELWCNGHPPKSSWAVWNRVGQCRESD